MRKVLLLTAAAVAVCAAYVVYPIWTLNRIQIAFAAGDADALEGFVDWPRLRDSARVEVQAMLASKVSTDDSSFGVLGTMIGAAMVGPLIDAWVSPTGMRKALAKRELGYKPPEIETARFITLTMFQAKLSHPGNPGVLLTTELEFGGGVWRLTRIAIPMDVIEAQMKQRGDTLSDVLK